MVNGCAARFLFLAIGGTDLEHRVTARAGFLTAVTVREMTIHKPARLVALFVLNCLIAIGGTAVISSEIRFNRHEVKTYAFKEDIAESAAALAVGYFVYHVRQYSVAKWIWVAGLCWWTQRALTYWSHQHGPLAGGHGAGSVFWHMSGAGCPFDRQSCSDWMFYTTLSLRVCFYSVGAWLCSRFKKHEAAALPTLKRAVLALRR